MKLDILKPHVLFKTIWFNLKNLPLKQAIKLPIMLNKATIKGNGKIFIDCPVYFGMIRMGFQQVSIYRNNGILFENNGEVHFKGSARIGSDSAISVGKTGRLEIGNNFVANAKLLMVCYDKIVIGHGVLFGWDIKMMDTDLHSLYKEENIKSKGYGSIIIGDNVWIASGCKIYKNISVPQNCVIASDTILHKLHNCGEMKIVSNQYTIKLNQGWRNPKDDKVDYIN